MIDVGSTATCVRTTCVPGVVRAGIIRILMDHRDEEFHTGYCLARYPDFKRCTCPEEVLAEAVWRDHVLVWTHPEICECDGCLWVG